MITQQTNAETLLKLLQGGPSLRVFVDVVAATEFAFPKGNQIAMGLFMRSLKAALAMDGIEVTGEAWIGEFNHGSYLICVEPSQVGMAALIVKGEVENVLAFAAHLVEIVDGLDAEESTVVSKTGDGWGSVGERREWALAWAKQAERDLEGDALKSARFHQGVHEQCQKLLETAERIEREMRERRDEGDQWKRPDDGGANQ